MQNYANMPGDRPEEYADKIVKALGGPPITPATKFGSLDQKQLDKVKDTIFNTEKCKTGEEVPYDSLKLPEEVRDRLRKYDPVVPTTPNSDGRAVVQTHAGCCAWDTLPCQRTSKSGPSSHGRAAAEPHPPRPTTGCPACDKCQPRQRHR
jgi:hypothetical protein